MDNYKPHAFIHIQHTKQKCSHLPKPNQKNWIFFSKKMSDTPYSKRKVVNKRLGNFVVIFIYLKDRNFLKKTLCGNWLIVRKITKISVFPLSSVVNRPFDLQNLTTTTFFNVQFFTF